MSEINKFSIANQLYYANNSVSQNKVAETKNSTRNDFNFEEINNLFSEGGISAVLPKLKELDAAGKIGNLQVQEDRNNGRTIISFTYNGTTFKLSGSVGDS